MRIELKDKKKNRRVRKTEKKDWVARDLYSINEGTVERGLWVDG